MKGSGLSSGSVIRRLVEGLRLLGHDEAAEMAAKFIVYLAELEKLPEVPKELFKYRALSCTGKKKLDEHAANKLAEVRNNELPCWQQQFQAYPCFFCDGWHVGRPRGEHFIISPYPTPGAYWEYQRQRIVVLLLRPWWLGCDPKQDGVLGSLLTLYFEFRGWEKPEKPETMRKMGEIFIEREME